MESYWNVSDVFFLSRTNYRFWYGLYMTTTRMRCNTMRVTSSVCEETRLSSLRTFELIVKRIIQRAPGSRCTLTHQLPICVPISPAGFNLLTAIQSIHYIIRSALVHSIVSTLIALMYRSDRSYSK